MAANQAMATPPRPGPGGYVNTPAPRTNSQLAPAFNATPAPQRQPHDLVPAASQGVGVTGPSSRPPENLTASERSARAINQALDQVRTAKALEQEYGGRLSYAYDLRSTPVWAPFQKSKSYNIPDEIFNQLNRAQVSTNMGLFAGLHYAWVTVDNALYLWDYTTQMPELLGFEDHPYSIDLVKLATPKPGVFLESIKHMIVLASTDQIILLGLGEDPSTPNAGLTLFQTGMAASIKGLTVTDIVSSKKTGRVFFGSGTDTDVRELRYQAQDSWFSSRCSVVNHTSGRLDSFTGALKSFTSGKSHYTVQMALDDSRDLLYTLSSDSVIRALNQVADGYGLDKKAEIGIQQIHSRVDHAVQNGPISNRSQISAISAIGEEETQAWVLMATTAEGYRIYLSATFSYGTPKMLHSLTPSHVRTPPMLAWNPAQAAPTQFNHVNDYLTKVTSAYRFPPGYFFASIARSENAATESIFVSVPDAKVDAQYVGHQQGSPESAGWIELKSKIMDIGFSIPYKGAAPTPQGFGNELAVQFDEAVPEVSVLTNTGIHILRRKRFVDSLSGLIRDGGGQEGFQTEINDLITKYGRHEVLADALAVACGQSVDTTSDRSLRINDPQVLEAARKIFIEHGGRPSIDQNLAQANAVPGIDAVRLSPRYYAAVMYVSRLIRSTWRQAIAREVRTAIGYQILCSVEAEKLRAIQENLTALQNFFNTNKNFIRGLSGPDDLTKQSTKDDEVALQGEHRAFHALVKFNTEMIEALSFVLVLFEEKVAEIVPLLPEQSRDTFMKITFQQLVATKIGMDVARDLVKAIVNRNIAKGSNVETIAEALRRKCGNFCSADDVVIFKAQELLKRAAEAKANVEASRISLNESLKLFEQVAKSLPQDYLQAAVRDYVELQFFAGAIQLALRVAYEHDKTNEAQAWISDGRMDNDPRREKFEERSRCYDLIHTVLEAVDTNMKTSPAFVDGRPSLSAVRRDEAYEVVSRSKDEVFLTNLYDWYLTKGWQKKLLETDNNSGFIVTYLQRKSTEDVSHADLLWEYYGKKSQFHEAAKVQLGLAQSAFSLSLDKRLEYLSRARANASAFTTTNNMTHRKTKQKLLTEINALIEVTNIQDDVLQRLRDDQRLRAGDAQHREAVLAELNGPVMSISDLYNKYADSAGYYDICLLIYAIADHRDATQISNTWKQFLEATHNAAIAQAANAEQGNEGAVATPVEKVAEVIRELGGRLKSSEAVFPVATLIEMLENYNVRYGQEIGARDVQDGVPGLVHWVPTIFIELEIPYELIYDTLETVYLSRNGPNATPADRRIILADLLFAIERWLQVSYTRAGQSLFGGEAGQMRVEELLAFLIDQQTPAQVGREEYRRAQRLRQRVVEMVA